MQKTLEVPFYSQHWELGRWSELGFASRDEAEYWMWSSCGVLALKSAIDAGRMLRGEELSPPIRQYIRDGVELKAYTHEAGWFHAGLVALAEKYGAHARALRRQSIDDVRKLLDDGNLVIASIKASFKTDKTLRERVKFWSKSGGHLALVTGYTNESPALVVHHASAHAERNYPDLHVGPRTFARAFTGSAIAVSLPKP